MCYTKPMQKAKHRTATVTKIVYVLTSPQTGNGVHAAWKPGDPPEKHPLFDLAGKYKDDPLFEESVQLMKKLRQEELERDLKWLDEAEAEATAEAELRAKAE